MINDPLTRARARLALHDVCRKHLFDRNITSIDVGFKSSDGMVNRDRLAIRFHVAKKLSGFSLEQAVEDGMTQILPRRAGEFDTDVLQGSYVPHLRAAPNPRLSRFDPLRGGISISRSGPYGAGTLGGVVFDRASGDPMILSNWHVLVANWASRPGIFIYQPARMDGGGLQDLIARLTRDAMAFNLDAAVASLEDSRRISDTQLEIGPVNGHADPVPGMRVVKSGRTTRVTHGEVTGVDGVAKLRYGYLDRLIRHVTTIEPVFAASELSMGGDSGSLYLDEATRSCVALHFAGSNNPERALAIHINPVLDALSVDMA